MPGRIASCWGFGVLLCAVLLAGLVPRPQPLAAQSETTTAYLPIIRTPSSSPPSPPPSTPNGWTPQPLQPASLGEPLSLDGGSTPFFADSVFDSSGDVAIWIPPNVETVRGIYFHHIAPVRARSSDPGFRSRAAQKRELASRQLASMWGFAYMSGMVWDQERRTYRLQEPFFHQALEEFAVATGHDELRYAPLVIRGESRTGAFSSRYASNHPERVIAYTVIVGGNSELAPGVPGLLIVGQRDHGEEIVNGNFMTDRGQGALLAAAMMWKINHKCDRCNDLAWPFADQMVQARLPADTDLSNGPVDLIPLDETQGWLGSVNSWQTILPYDRYPADARRTAVWLHNRSMAYLWRSFVARDPVGRMTAPTHSYRWSRGFSQEPAPIYRNEDSGYRAGQPLTLVATFSEPVSGPVHFYNGDEQLGIATLSDGGKRAELTNVVMGVGLHSLFAMEENRPLTRPAGIILVP